MAASISVISKAGELFSIDKFDEFQVDVLNKLLERTIIFLCMKMVRAKVYVTKRSIHFGK